MKRLLFGLWMIAAGASAQINDPGKVVSVLGDWWTPGFNARVRIEACGDAVCGRIVWMWDEAPGDIADKKPLIGRRVVEGMRAETGQRWSGGRLYNPEDGRDYTGALQLHSANRLDVEGCVLFICKRQLWHRADPNRCPPVAAEEVRS